MGRGSGLRFYAATRNTPRGAAARACCAALATSPGPEPWAIHMTHSRRSTHRNSSPARIFFLCRVERLSGHGRSGARGEENEQATARLRQNQMTRRIGKRHFLSASMTVLPMPNDQLTLKLCC